MPNKELFRERVFFVQPLAKQLSLEVIYVETCELQECVSASGRTRRLFLVVEGTEHGVDGRQKVLNRRRVELRIYLINLMNELEF